MSTDMICSHWLTGFLHCPAPGLRIAATLCCLGGSTQHSTRANGHDLGSERGAAQLDIGGHGSLGLGHRGDAHKAMRRLWPDHRGILRLLHGCLPDPEGEMGSGPAHPVVLRMRSDTRLLPLLPP